MNMKDIYDVPNVYLPKLAQLALTGRAKDAMIAFKRQNKNDQNKGDLTWEELQALLESLVIGTRGCFKTNKTHR